MQTRYFRVFIVTAVVIGIAGASFFVANRLSQNGSVALNSPDSKPLAVVSTKTIVRSDVDVRVTTAPVQAKATPKPKDDSEETPPPRTNNTNLATPDYLLPAQPTVKVNTPIISPSVTPPAKPQSPDPTPGYGTRATEEQKQTIPYMSDDANKCTDNLGFVSGTGCFPIPGTNIVERRVLALPNTQNAANQAIKDAQDKIANKSDAEIIEIANNNGTNNCGQNDYSCLDRLIKNTTTKLLIDNAVFATKDIDKLVNARDKNQKVNDVIALNDKDFVAKYGDNQLNILNSLNLPNSTSLNSASKLLNAYRDPNTNIYNLINIACSSQTYKDPTCKQDLAYLSREQILKDYIGDTVSNDYVNQTINQYKNQERATKYIDLYLDTTKTDEEKIKEYCQSLQGYSLSTCIKNTKIDNLAQYSADPTTLINLKTQYENDQKYALIYSDPTNSFSKLLSTFCKDSADPKCEEHFYNTSDFLSLINDPQTKQVASNNRIAQLNLLIPNVVNGQPVSGINNETKKEVIKLNQEITQAYWVYLKENRARQVTKGVTSEELALEFDALIKQNPNVLTDNLKKYNDNPNSYNLPTAIKFDKEENPLIIAQYNQIIKNQPIAGLSNNGKAVIWDNANNIYKVKAMAQSCQDGANILSQNECKSLNGIINNLDDFNNPSTTDTGLIDSLATGLLAKKFSESNNPQAYLQTVYDNLTKSNLLTVNQSNLATIDNPTTDPILRAEIEKAKNAADVADIKNQMAYNTVTYGANMGMTPIIIPTSYKGNGTKLTAEEKKQSCQ